MITNVASIQRLAYLGAALLFIFSLRGLSTPDDTLFAAHYRPIKIKPRGRPRAGGGNWLRSGASQADCCNR